MLIKWGSIVVEGSGKLGGHVYYKGKGDAVIRTLARAKNPQTRSQQTIKSRFTKLTQDWSNLTEVQRQSWNQATSSFSRKNRFGDVVFLTGKNLYNALNAQRLIIGLPILVMAPLPTTIDAAIITQASILLRSEIFIIRGDFAGSTKYVVLATPSLSQGISNFKDKFRIIGVGITDSNGRDITGFSTQYDAYVNVFGVPIKGSKVFIGLYSINSTGQKAIISSRIVLII